METSEYLKVNTPTCRERLEQAGLLPDPGRWSVVWVQEPGGMPEEMILYHVPAYNRLHRTPPIRHDLIEDVRQGGGSLTFSWRRIAFFRPEDFKNFPGKYDPYNHGDYDIMIKRLATYRIDSINSRNFALNLFIWPKESDPASENPSVVFFEPLADASWLKYTVSFGDVVKVFLLFLKNARIKYL